MVKVLGKINSAKYFDTEGVYTNIKVVTKIKYLLDHNDLCVHE
jgi:hypothetical protein